MVLTEAKYELIGNKSLCRLLQCYQR